jgi:hypothetical protein
MPCYDGQNDNRNYGRTETVYVDRDNPQDKRKIAELIDQTKWFEGALCAIITELENRGIANEVISQASKSGLIGIMNFWERHSKEDETRLAVELHKFSEHEQDVLKRLLNSRYGRKD